MWFAKYDMVKNFEFYSNTFQYSTMHICDAAHWKEDFEEVDVSHFITIEMVNVSHAIIIFWFCTFRLMLTSIEKNPSLLEDLFQEKNQSNNKECGQHGPWSWC